MTERSEMSRRVRRVNLWIWVILTVVSGGSIAGFIPIKIDRILDGWPLRELTSEKADQQDKPFGSTRVPVPNSGLEGVVDENATADRPLLIASFNIQVLGQSKMSKPNVVGILAETIRRFDLVAIQEVRSKEENVLPRLIQAINSDGDNYSFLIGPRLGRTVSKEQYAFVFDTDRVEYDPGSIGTISDPDDLLHREPFVTRFRAKTADADRAFTFWLVNAHIDPDEVPQELDALADVFRVMQQNQLDEDDVILLGDLNAAPSKFGPLRTIPGIQWVVEGTPTNTRRTKTYDNLLFTGSTTREYTGRWGVFDIEREFGISMQESLQVSDHMPVWSEFSQWEMSAVSP